MRDKTRKKGVSPKLTDRFRGPYIILQKFGTVYEVLISPKKSKLYHFDLMKPCFKSEGLPNWVKRARKSINHGEAVTIG